MQLGSLASYQLNTNPPQVPKVYCQPVRWGEVGVDRPSAKVLRYGSPYLMIRDVFAIGLSFKVCEHGKETLQIVAGTVSGTTEQAIPSTWHLAPCPSPSTVG
jgi:hypothetical protein